jgi:hypothetical protein
MVVSGSERFIRLSHVAAETAGEASAITARNADQQAKRRTLQDLMERSFVLSLQVVRSNGGWSTYTQPPFSFDVKQRAASGQTCER